MTTEFAEQASSSNTFEIRLRSIFITAPQNSSDPEEVLGKLKTLFLRYEIKFIIIVQEVHLDGNFHLHAIVRVTNQPKVKSNKVDDAFGKHVNIQKIKSQSHAIKYLQKAGEPLFFSPDNTCTLETLTTVKPAKKFEKIAKRLRDEEDFDILEEEPGFLLQHSKKVVDFQTIVIRKKMKLSTIPKYPVLVNTLKEWQLKALKILLQQDERQILWVTDHQGGKGKTWLANYLMNKYDAFYWRSSKKADIAFAYNYEPVVVFDFVRTNEDTVSYEMIEQFKDGLIVSTKYESLIKKRKDIKVIVFSNFEPKFDSLSHDRWVYMKLFPTFSRFTDHAGNRLALSDLYASEEELSDIE